ncbi:hypothetical protein [Streptomyces sp. NPDC059979]
MNVAEMVPLALLVANAVRFLEIRIRDVPAAAPVRGGEQLWGSV